MAKPNPPQKQENPVPEAPVAGAPVADAPVADAPVAEALAPRDHNDLMGTRAWVVAVHGSMVNLFTSEVVHQEPKKVKIDQFYINQLDAGKMQLHVDEA